MIKSNNFIVSRRKVIIATAVSAAATTLPAHAQTIPLADAPSSMPVSFMINGKRADLMLDTRTTLLDALREHLKLTGTKKGCDHGQCSQWLLVDGLDVRSVIRWTAAVGPDTGRQLLRQASELTGRQRQPVYVRRVRSLGLC